MNNDICVLINRLKMKSSYESRNVLSALRAQVTLLVKKSYRSGSSKYLTALDNLDYALKEFYYAAGEEDYSTKQQCVVDAHRFIKFAEEELEED